MSTAKALAQADETLDEATRCIKRAAQLERRASQLMRQAQVNLRGITVVTEPAQPTEGHSDDDTDSEQEG